MMDLYEHCEHEDAPGCAACQRDRALADLKAMTVARDNWHRKYGELRDTHKGAVEALETAQGEAYLGALADGDPLKACHEVMRVCAEAVTRLRGQ